MRHMSRCVVAFAMFMTGCSRDVEVEAERRPASHRLSCPAPGALPFDLGSEGFEHPEFAGLAGPVADVASDTLGNLGGRVSSTDEPLSAAPVARNVHYVGRKASYESGEADAPTPLAGEFVSLWFFDPRANGWAWTGRTRTDGDGQYRFVDTVAERPSTEPVYAMLDANGTCAAHYDALYPPGMPVVLTEIDGVLTATESRLARRGAAAAMRAWEEKGYPIVYLTRRGEDARAPTRTWLDTEGFPPGPLVTGPADDAFKPTWIDRMYSAFGWRFVAAYAASEEDVAAYREGGAGAARVFAVDFEAPHECVTLTSFDDHRDDFIEMEPDAPHL